VEADMKKLFSLYALGAQQGYAGAGKNACGSGSAAFFKCLLCIRPAM